MKLSLVVPCYNEADSVRLFLDAVIADFDGCGYDYEVIFVNDGSKDNTLLTMIKLAKDNEVNYVVDIFPFYGSDVGAAYRSGVDTKGALIGQGVHASHGMERTHIDGITNTMKLLTLYLMSK